MSRDDKNRDEQKDTALEEVLREIEDAETRAGGSAERGRHEGEAGDAITPNVGAQEESEG
ncbi:hypothetical protein [Streptomyces gilvus]|uniref:hypothetical protein n=1 Tax=Streptomyces gilvus TaxID=2920937 RepID=UPI001F0E952B|nr:hypothetical protein [Streptomyces sp. CME 23]MCH5671321.1 hypothetical protein [Streptomyces sp. CME 23]